MRTTRHSAIVLSDSPSVLHPTPSSSPLPVPRRKRGSTSNPPPRNPPPMQVWNEMWLFIVHENMYTYMQVWNVTFHSLKFLFSGNPTCRPDSCSNSYPNCSRNMSCVSQVLLQIKYDIMHMKRTRGKRPFECSNSFLFNTWIMISFDAVCLFVIYNGAGLALPVRKVWSRTGLTRKASANTRWVVSC